MRLVALSATTLAVLALSAGAAFGHDGPGIRQSGEQKDMRRVGHTDLQGRPAYHPTFIKYPDGRVIAFVGTHGGSKPNPLKAGAVELNGTMIIDITNPARPVEKFHIPAPASGAQTQSNRACLGSDLPEAERSKLELLRTDTPTFTAVVESRRNRYDEWYLYQAGKVELCNVPMPVRMPEAKP